MRIRGIGKIKSCFFKISELRLQRVNGEPKTGVLEKEPVKPTVLRLEFTSHKNIYKVEMNKYYKILQGHVTVSLTE